MAEEKNLYPELVVENNKNPNRWYAFPLIGLMVRLVFLLPVFLELLFLGIFSFFVLVTNWFVILFTRNYWNFAYRYFLGVMRLSGKVRLFIWGITDTYPGFSFSTKGIYTLTFTKPEKPSLLLAFPVIGILIRFILLIPYFIFNEVLDRGAGLAMVISWFTVLFKKRFPESLYEFERDSLRVSFAASAYIVGFSDKYPSFAISMNHQTIKILLIIAGAMLFASDFPTNFLQEDKKFQYQSELPSKSFYPDGYKGSDLMVSPPQYNTEKYY